MKLKLILTNMKSQQMTLKMFVTILVVKLIKLLEFSMS